jgi:hypothetical protein
LVSATSELDLAVVLVDIYSTQLEEIAAATAMLEGSRRAR